MNTKCHLIATCSLFGRWLPPAHHLTLNLMRFCIPCTLWFIRIPGNRMYNFEAATSRVCVRSFTSPAPHEGVASVSFQAHRTLGLSVNDLGEQSSRAEPSRLYLLSFAATQHTFSHHQRNKSVSAISCFILFMTQFSAVYSPAACYSWSVFW